MPGKHAPDSPVSFVLSLARWGGLVLGALSVVVAIALVVTGGNGAKPSLAGPTPTDTPSSTASPKTSVRPTPTRSVNDPAVRAPADTTVSVLNATARAGLARRVGNQLADEGYRVLERANYGKTAARTLIYYRQGWDAEARALLRKHPELSQVKPAPADLQGEAGLTVILGNDYP